MTEGLSQDVERTAGVIGLGAMGGPMAGHMAEGGFAVVAFDPDPPACERADARVACLATPAEVAQRSHLTLVIVPTDEDVLSACTGIDGIFSQPGGGRIVAVCSSVRPETIRALESPAAAAGFALLDIPLTKGVRAAVAGNLTLLAGGDADALAGARPFLECFSTAIHHVGGLGIGQVAKTVNNLLLWSGVVAVAESLRFATKLGADPAALRDAMMDCSADSWVLREFDRIVPTWPAKDMKNALAMAAAAGIELPLMNRVAEEIGACDQETLNRILAGGQGE